MPEIKELKTITETAIMREDADPNKLHHDKLRDIAKEWPIDDATIVIDELVKKYSTVMMMALSAHMDEMSIKLSNIKCDLEGIR